MRTLIISFLNPSWRVVILQPIWYILNQHLLTLMVVHPNDVYTPLTFIGKSSTIHCPTKIGVLYKYSKSLGFYFKKITTIIFIDKFC